MLGLHVERNVGYILALGDSHSVCVMWMRDMLRQLFLTMCLLLQSNLHYVPFHFCAICTISHVYISHFAIDKWRSECLNSRKTLKKYNTKICFLYFLVQLGSNNIHAALYFSLY